MTITVIRILLLMNRLLSSINPHRDREGGRIELILSAPRIILEGALTTRSYQIGHSRSPEN